MRRFASLIAVLLLSACSVLQVRRNLRRLSPITRRKSVAIKRKDYSGWGP